MENDSVLPIPGAKNGAQAVANAQALSFSLSPDEGFRLSSSQDAGGDLAVGAIGVLAWLMRRGRRALRATPSRAGAAEAEAPPAAPSVMGVGWDVVDPAGIVDAATAAVLLGTTVVTGGATIAVHLNQYGMNVRSGQWWDDAARLEHLIECGILLSDRAHALGARPSERR